MHQRAILHIAGNRFDAPNTERLSKLLESIPGVISVFIGQQTEMAYVVYDPILLDLLSLQRLIENAGWRIDVTRVHKTR